MRLSKLLIFFSWLVILAQPVEGSISQAQKKSDFDILSSWRIFLQLESTQPEQAIHALESLYEDQLNGQIDALPMISDALVRKVGSQKHRYRNFMEHPYWPFAKRFNPFSPNPDYLICQQSKGTNLLERINYCWTGFKTDLKTQKGRMFWAAQASHVLYLTLFYVVLLVVFALFLKYLAFLFQYTSSKFIWLSPMATGFFSCVVVACVTLSFGWVIGLTLVGAVLWKFLAKSERFVMILLFVCTALIPLTFEAPAKYIEYERQNIGSPILVSAQSEKILFSSSKPFALGGFKNHFTKTMYQKTFYHHNNVQLFSMLGLAGLLMFLLGMFNHVGDYYFIFEKQQIKSKRLILRDLAAYPKLYFNFLKQLKKEDRLSKFLYYVFPPYYYFEQEKPLIGLILSFMYVLCIVGLFVSASYLHQSRFFLTLLWSLGLGLFLIISWALPKNTKNTELYGQKVIHSK